MTKVICFDLEGPLSPQDNAYEVMGSLPEGYKIFEVISRYDDVLVLEKRENYEPGDTLALIVPFLIYHGISEDEIKKISAKARIIPGAKELIAKLKEMNWETYIISTSYQQHAFSVGERLGVEKENIFCTNFPLDDFKKELEGADFSLVKEMEKVMLEELSQSQDEEKLRRIMDEFFWEKLPQTEIGEVMARVKVRGGRRKLEAAREIGKKTGKNLEEMIVVGDSITDFKMLEEVKNSGGIAVVFNGNQYALPYGNVGLATDDMLDLLGIIEAYGQGGKERVKEVVKEKEQENSEEGPCFNWLETSDLKKIAPVHKKFRALMRGEAAKLG